MIALHDLRCVALRKNIKGRTPVAKLCSQRSPQGRNEGADSTRGSEKAASCSAYTAASSTCAAGFNTEVVGDCAVICGKFCEPGHVLSLTEGCWLHKIGSYAKALPNSMERGQQRRNSSS